MSALFLSRVMLFLSAVVSFIIGPHAAKAYPKASPSASGTEPSLRSYKRYSLVSPEPGSATAQNLKALDGGDDAPSVIYVQPNLLRKGHLNSNPNPRQRNLPHFEVHGGQGKSSRMDHNSFSQSRNGGASGFVAPHNGRSQSSLAPLVRNPSQQRRPLRQRAYDREQIPRSGTSTLPESRSKDRIDTWQSPGSPDSPRSRGYWNAQSNSMGHDGKEEQVGSSGVRSHKPPKSSVSAFQPQKLTSSVTTLLSQAEFTPTGGGKTSYRRVQSHLLRNFHTTEAPKGGNVQNPQRYVHRGRVFNQQTRANVQSASMSMHDENRFEGNVRDARKYGLASVIYRAPNQNTSTPLKDPSGAKDAESSLVDTRRATKPYESVKRIESYMRPYRLQKYSFGQRAVPHEKTTSPKSLSTQDDDKSDRQPLAKLLKLTSLRPQTEDGATLTPVNRRHKQGKVKDVEFKTVTYADIIGSASFSSVTHGVDLEKSKASSPKEMVHETGKAFGGQRNVDNSDGGKKMDFGKGEAETELRISDLGLSEKRSEAKSVPRGLPSDPEEDGETDRLEMDYLRTATGNISFQSLNLNL